jgi:hypothetical protein
MPLRKVKGGWKIGSGPTIKTKAKALRAYRGYLYAKSRKK